MISAERWKVICDTPLSELDAFELWQELNKKFRCARCGREDLPLALYRAHNKSCAYECGIGMSSTLDLHEEIQRLKEQIEDLTVPLRCKDCGGLFDREHMHSDFQCIYCHPYHR